MRRRTKAILIVAGILATLSALSGIAIATVSLTAWPSVSKTIPDEVTEIQVRAKDNVLLSAWVFQPDHPNGATVIALHGHRDTRRGVAGVARFLRDAGYQVIAPDSRGHGKSGGDRITFGILESDDVHTWADWAYEQNHDARLYGFGCSYGAAVMLQSLPKEARLRAVVADSSFRSFHYVAYDRVSGMFGVPAAEGHAILWPIVEPGLLYARLAMGIDLYSASPLEAIRTTKKPVFLIHGMDDTNIPPEHSRLIQAARPQNTTLWQVPGATHTASFGMNPTEYQRRVLEFFAAN